MQTIELIMYGKTKNTKIILNCSYTTPRKNMWDTKIYYVLKKF